ncbi:MAG: epoxyqueuosine reductase QueH [Planctomycetes bacterium]|nr:epoxyqueuosine reductase QueH [Planctomycetota bacterium]
MKLLMHVCCAPCFCAPLEQLRGEGVGVTGYFYNPNIHPLLEFRKRLKAVKTLHGAVKVDMIYSEDYGLTEFLRMAFDKPQPRCELCWGMRLNKTARVAKERGFDAFSTTLLISRRQDHDAIGRIGQEAAERHGVEFFYRDFRPLDDRSRAMAKERSLYRQQYCGCMFSEYDRYKDTTRELYRGEGE